MDLNIFDITAWWRGGREGGVIEEWSYLPLAPIALEKTNVVSHNPTLLHEEHILERTYKIFCVPPSLSKSARKLDR